MSEFELSMSVPLDSDGFMRRACPTCERELKWVAAAQGEEATPAPEGGYYCPYCAIQGPAGAWWTEAQLEIAKATAFREVVGPELEGLAGSARRASSGFLSVDVEITPPSEPPPLTEPDDMRRVDFACHPEDPVKVLDDWTRSVHCPICGLAANDDSGAPGTAARRED